MLLKAMGSVKSNIFFTSEPLSISVWLLNIVKCTKINIRKLDNEPFLLLEHGGKTEVSEILEKNNVHPNIRFTTWEDFAIMSMVEKGLGAAILPELILQRVNYEIEIRPLEEPYYRKICIAMKNKERLTPAAAKFMEYLVQHRKEQ